MPDQNNAAYPLVRITGIRQETPDVKTFFLQSEHPLQYRAGQFITFAYTLPNGSVVHRSYSFSSCPQTDAVPSITVKRVPNGIFSRPLLDTAREGDVLNFVHISGFFTLPESSGTTGQIMLWAAGVGITPVYSLLKSILAGTSLPVVLFYSNRSLADTVFYQELQELELHYKGRFHTIHLLSDSRNLLRARLHKGLLPQLLAENSLTAPEQQLHFVCGPFDYRRMVIWTLQEAGVPNANIRKEAFLDPPKRFSPEPPDKSPHQAILLRGKDEVVVEVVYPDTILQAARKQGIAIPYSCEAGRCGACAALCHSGKVWMSYNEVLTDEDMAKGLVLTCTGHPQEGDVTLSF